MTHPLTPREKVALKPCPMCGMTDSTDNATQESGLHIQSFRSPAGGDACRVQCACGVSGPSSREDWQAAEKWNRRTALASGSGSGDQLSGNPGILKSGYGDHSGGVTDMIDHEELARLAEAATPGEWRVGENNNPFADGRHVFAKGFGGSDFVVLNLKTDHTFVTATSREQQQRNALFAAAANPATVLALLAEIAALRAMAEKVAGGSMDQTDKLLAMHTRATEAERKLAEAVGLLSELEQHVRAASEGHGHARAGVKSADAARTFLSKEAERG